MPTTGADDTDGPVLATARLRLRPLARGDMPRVVELAGVPEVALMTASIPHPYSLEQGHAWFEAMSAGGGLRPFAIELAGEVIGLAGFIPGRGGRPVEIGYWLGRPYWGQGYMTEAVEALVAFGFAHFGTRRIVASVFPGNAASRRVVERCGFRRCGTGTFPAPARGGDREVDIYERLAAGAEADG